MGENIIRIGVTGWSIRSEHAAWFPGEGTHLERYAWRFNAVEVTSSFYRPHQPATYARWAASTPERFRFAVKVPRQVTHVHRLGDPTPLARFREQTAALGEKLGLWLVQLPPGLRFHAPTVERFFDALRACYEGEVVCEPRHVSWFIPEAGRLLERFHVARAAADPAVCPEATRPGGWEGLVYYRLHGSPRLYYSAYGEEFLAAFAETLKAYARRAPVWCFFNNTAEGKATPNALFLREKVGAET